MGDAPCIQACCERLVSTRLGPWRFFSRRIAHPAISPQPQRTRMLETGTMTAPCIAVSLPQSFLEAVWDSSTSFLQGDIPSDQTKDPKGRHVNLGTVSFRSISGNPGTSAYARTSYPIVVGFWRTLLAESALVGHAAMSTLPHGVGLRAFLSGCSRGHRGVAVNPSKNKQAWMFPHSCS
ncbi:hypothetical protein JX266_008560 [Neoarthrinium moseri]|nr:hypothetical protein JX266_008560 [Neoarthrinium moseri]